MVPMAFLIFCVVLFCFWMWWSKLKTNRTFFTFFFSISLLVSSQYIDFHVSSCVFSVPMWCMCNCVSTLCCSVASIMILLPFGAILSMTSKSSWNGQYVCISALTSCQLHMMWVPEDVHQSALLLLFPAQTCFLGCQCNLVLNLGSDSEQFLNLSSHNGSV